MYYIYKDKYNEEKYSLNTKNKKNYYKKLRLTDDYQYVSIEEKEEEKQQKTSKNPDKNESPKKTIKDDLSGFKEWVNRKGTGINYELFQKHFKFQRNSNTLKAVYTRNDKNKNSKLVNMIKSG